MRLLLAIYVFTTSVSMALFMIFMSLAGETDQEIPYQITQSSITLASCCAAFLSYFLWKGTEWAYKLLIYIFGIGAVSILGLGALAISDIDRPFLLVASDFMLLVALITTPIFLILLMLHPGIKNLYRNNGSNEKP